ncbi:MAG: nitrite reductase small subunit NirD [Candidatus Velthaea sp.]
MASEYVPIAKVAEIAPGSGKAFTVGTREIAVFNIDGTFYALDNTCPHQGGPLAEGWIEGATVTCPWHAWCFKMSDGKMTLGDYAEVDAFDVRVEGDTVSVKREAKAGV